MKKLEKFSMFVLLYNIFVIMVGSFVRATGAGARCEAHWPTCNGEVLPTDPQLEAIIEFTHRLTSGLTIILVLILFVWVYRVYCKGSKIRKAAFFILVFVIFQVLIGAGLELFEVFGENSSVLRVLVIALHLINTFLILASNALVYEWVKFGEPGGMKITRGARQFFATLGILFLLLGATGAMTALGDPFIKAESLPQGLTQDFTGENLLVKLRIYHPLIGILIAILVYLLFINFLKNIKNIKMNQYYKKLSFLFILQLVIGGINFFLLAPIWLQIIHLLMADVVWVFFILWMNQVIYYGFVPSMPDKPTGPEQGREIALKSCLNDKKTYFQTLEKSDIVFCKFH